MTEKIRDALAALDPARDEDWTSAGLPAMAAVRAFAGDGVTREQVEAAAPGFCRTDLAIPSDQETVVETTVSVETSTKISGPADEDATRARLRAAQEKRSASLRAMAEAKRLADEAEREIVQARNELEPKPLTAIERYRQVVKRSQEDRKKRVEEEQAARAILSGAKRSKLDQAMTARRGYGLKRPTYPTVG